MKLSFRKSYFNMVKQQLKKKVWFDQIPPWPGLPLLPYLLEFINVGIALLWTFTLSQLQVGEKFVILSHVFRNTVHIALGWTLCIFFDSCTKAVSQLELCEKFVLCRNFLFFVTFHYFELSYTTPLIHESRKICKVQIWGYVA